MAKFKMMDMLHLSFFAPLDLSKAENRAIRSTLNGPIFKKHLRRSARAVVRSYRALSKVQLTIKG